jgi:DNA adenine methylase
MMSEILRAPFPYFGGKRDVVDLVWQRLGSVRQYIEPFCGSAAMLLGAKEPASLEVVNDMNGFLANFWRAVKHQPAEVAREADYPVSHIDLGGRHVWLMEQRGRVAELLSDPCSPGDARVAGWWLWGQCCWIGSGWCEWSKADTSQVPHASDAGMGIQALGKVPHASNAGRGIQALGQVPHASDAGMGIQALGQVPHAGNAGRGMDALLTSAGRTAWRWLHELSARLERVRIVHGDWHRCLNNHYGGDSTAVFLDPPYRAYEKLYGVTEPVADAVEAWAAENASLRVAICGHRGDYPRLDGAGYACVPWTRKRLTYAGSSTTDLEAIWFSPACIVPRDVRQMGLFAS